MLSLFSTNSIIETICLFFALYFLAKDKLGFWKIVVIYMIIVPFTELTGKHIARVYHNNIWIYNVFSLFEAAFILYGLNYFLSDFTKKIQKWIIATFIIIIIAFVAHIIISGITIYNTFMVSMMSIFFVIYGLIYFYLLLIDENYIDLKFHPAFWWVGGVLIFYFGSTLANFFEDYFRIKIYGKSTLRYFIYTTINIFLYGFWSYSFICRARQRKSFL
ncbi:hypothetical protein [Pedobacter aquatilis]|uniref:hypothetical protein n=1 Tax=Pedobacter aquatilis TaxID=351343 RepID=UPI00292D43DA|nr:hypothetical protein [Pedobacter aquatilis]